MVNFGEAAHLEGRKVLLGRKDWQEWLDMLGGLPLLCDGLPAMGDV